MNSPRRPFPPVACKLIGICGHAGSGKDTVADYIRHAHDDTWKLAFADPVKDAAAQMFGTPIECFRTSALKELPDPFWGVSPRQMAQFFGTEMVRETVGKLLPGIGKDFWIHRLIYRLTGQGEEATYTEDDVVVISDVRFQNEYDWIIDQGGIIIHLTRPGADGTVGIPGHASEAGLCFDANPQTHYIVNNSTLEELHEKVAAILTTANIYPFDDSDSF
jgi:hypothetical protein